MAYFPNGQAGYVFEARNCERCVNYRDRPERREEGIGCPVMDLHRPQHQTPLRFHVEKLDLVFLEIEQLRDAEHTLKGFVLVRRPALRIRRG